MDADGVQDPGEPELDGVLLNAVWAGPDGILGTADDVALSDSTIAGNSYLFTGLPAGLYDPVFTCDGETFVTPVPEDQEGLVDGVTTLIEVGLTTIVNFEIDNLALN